MPKEKVRGLIEIVTKAEESKSSVPVSGERTDAVYRDILLPIAHERVYVHPDKKRLKAYDKLARLKRRGHLSHELVLETTHLLSDHEREMGRIRKEKRRETKKSLIKTGIFVGVLAALSYTGVRVFLYEEKKRDEQSFIRQFENTVRFREKYKQELEKIMGQNIEISPKNPYVRFIEKLIGGDIKSSSEDFYVGWIERLDSEIGYFKEEVKKKMSGGYRPILRKEYERNFGSEPWWPEDK